MVERLQLDGIAEVEKARMNEVSVTSASLGVGRELAEWISTAEPLSSAVRAQARIMLIDTVGVAVRGALSPTSALVRAALAEAMPGSSPLLGTTATAGLAGAIIANGVAAHALELDDGYTRGSIHPSAVVLPAVLAAVAARGGSVGDVTDALAIGNEVTCRLARAGHPETYRRGFHNTPLAGTIGAAAASARALRLDPEQTLSAIGIACSQVSGLFEFLEDGASVKKLHPGIAAHNGWQSAMFARAGLTGPRYGLEGQRGYFSTYVGDRHTAPLSLLENLGTQWLLSDMYVKPYPCCRALHGAVDILLQLRTEAGLHWEDVSAVRIETYGKAAEYGNRLIRSVGDAQMSMPVAAYLSLRDGGITIERLAELAAALPDPATFQNIEVVHRLEFDAAYPPQRPVQVTVLARGREWRGFSDAPSGEPGNRLTNAALAAKYDGLAAAVLGKPGAAALRDVLERDDMAATELLARAVPDTAQTSEG
jgi:2-methylcitrate dehydratase PrpD